MINDNLQQSSSGGPKKLEEITLDDIKDAAIVYAAQFELYIQRSDCRVTPISNRRRIAEIGSNTDIKLPITKWLVTILQKNTFSKGVAITVEYLTGDVCAMDFKPL